MGRISDFSDMIRERRVGFRMNEVMSGDHEFEPGWGPDGRFPFEFRVAWGPKNLGAWLNPWSEQFLTHPLEGTVTVGGLCKKAPCKGTMELRYFRDYKIRYTFDFTVDGTRYHYVGDKVNIKPWNLPVSHTTCFGVLTEAETGRLISRSVTHFRMRTTPAFLLSFRLA
jgi:hypothetical protein